VFGMAGDYSVVNRQVDRHVKLVTVACGWSQQFGEHESDGMRRRKVIVC
jgi:hypothetical protein